MWVDSIRQIAAPFQGSLNHYVVHTTILDDQEGGIASWTPPDQPVPMSQGLISHSIVGLRLYRHTAGDSAPVKPIHGRHLRMTGPFHFELVAKDGEFTVYVTDHAGNNIGVDGGLAKTTIETGSTIKGGPSRIQVELEPSGENTRKGTGSFTINQDSGIMVFLKLPEQEAYAACFTPLGQKQLPDKKG